MDRISQLPEAILHHILSFLSQNEATQTCLLSKSWRYVWSTRPNIEFLEEDWLKKNKLRYVWPPIRPKFLEQENKVAFLSVLDKTLQGYYDQKLRIQEFHMKILKLDSDTILLIEKWISIVMVNMGVKTFNLYLISNPWEFFALPSVVFKAESLQKLYLYGCKLIQKPLDKVLFKHLQTLHLTRVYIDDEIFHKIISSCPLIEVVGLDRCEGLRTIKVNKDHNLKEFNFSDVPWYIKDDDCSIEIDVQTLVTIEILGCGHWYHPHKYLPRLKSLCLINVKLASWPFDVLSGNYLPSLEDLTVRCCSGLKELKLLNHSIKHLTIEGLDGPDNKVAIDAPNIVKFKYVGDIPPSIAFATTFSEWKSVITLQDDVDFGDDDHALLSRFLKLNKLLKESNIKLYRALHGSKIRRCPLDMATRCGR
ncbi:hypothetical protein DH2020_013439 [Rehmannia glutinosa]|uniref:F-box domain-containing protein n=1 Tax=Rehmannia glutinosa TaxID=99300 RepID=A0ABR0X2X6_REHGL